MNGVSDLSDADGSDYVSTLVSILEALDITPKLQ
jgi:hypothetical protein